MIAQDSKCAAAARARADQVPIAPEHTKLLLGGTWIEWGAPISSAAVLAIMPDDFHLRGLGLLKQKYRQFRPGCIVASGYYQSGRDRLTRIQREVLVFIPGKLEGNGGAS